MAYISTPGFFLHALDVVTGEPLANWGVGVPIDGFPPTGSQDMLADIVEHSQEATGRREEGLFFASRSFAQKATSGIGAFVAGIALDLISFPKGAALGEVEPDTVWNLGFIYGPLLMVFYFLALGSISFYQITRVGHDGRVDRLHSVVGGAGGGR